MSLNNILLPAQLLTALYQKALVEEDASGVPQKKGVSFLGGNAKNILILIKEKKAAFLPGKELEFLTTILSACQLSLSDVAIVNCNGDEGNSADTVKQFSPKEILFLDVSPDVFDFPLPSSQYTIMERETVRYLFAPSLGQIEKTRQAKSDLWQALKQLFCLK